MWGQSSTGRFGIELREKQHWIEIKSSSGQMWTFVPFLRFNKNVRKCGWKENSVRVYFVCPITNPLFLSIISGKKKNQRGQLATHRNLQEFRCMYFVEATTTIAIASSLLCGTSGSLSSAHIKLVNKNTRRKRLTSPEASTNLTGLVSQPLASSLNNEYNSSY